MDDTIAAVLSQRFSLNEYEGLLPSCSTASKILLFLEGLYLPTFSLDCFRYLNKIPRNLSDEPGGLVSLVPAGLLHVTSPVVSLHFV